MTEPTTILAPVHYPLTDQSAQTLAVAGRLAHEHAPANLRVLHVNLYQAGNDTKATELTEAISSTLDGVEASVTTQQGFLVEEVILEEANQIGAEIVVIGVNQQPIWRRFLRRLVQNDPDISSFLRDHTTSDTEIMEIDETSGVPAVDPA